MNNESNEAQVTVQNKQEAELNTVGCIISLLVLFFLSWTLFRVAPRYANCLINGHFMSMTICRYDEEVPFASCGGQPCPTFNGPPSGTIVQKYYKLLRP